jgi:hypothetical protein
MVAQAQTIFKELDLSERGGSADGVYVCFTAGFKKGKANDFTLCTNEKQILKRYTFDEAIGFSDPTALFDALEAVKQSKTVLMCRAINGATYAGARVISGDYVVGALNEVNADFTTVFASSDTDITLAAADEYGLETGTPVTLSSTTALPAGLSDSTTYYLGEQAAGVYKLYDSEANAITNDGSTGVQAFTDDGTGTHTLQANLNLLVDSTQFQASDVDITENSINLDSAFVAQLITGEKVIFSGGDLPAGITQGTTYYAVRFSSLGSIDPDTIKVAESEAEAKAISSTVTVTVATDTFTSAGITSLVQGQAVQFTTTDTLPTGLSALTDYFVIPVTDTTFKLASSKPLAIAGTPDIVITSPGLGTHTVAPTFLDITSIGTGTSTISKREHSGLASSGNFIVNVTNDRLVIPNILGQKLQDGDIVRVATSTGGTLPAPLAPATDYFVKALSEIEIELYSDISLDTLALINIADIGDGVHTITTQPSVTDPSAVDLGTNDAILLYSADEGAWGNRLYYTITDNSAKEPDSFYITVYKDTNLNVPAENPWLVSRKQKKDGFGNNIFMEDVLEQSDFIRGIVNPDVDENILPKEELVPVPLSGGDDGLAVNSGSLITAADSVSNPADTPLRLICDGGFTRPAFQQKIEEIARLRGTAAAVLSTPIAKEKSANYLQDLIDWKQTELILNSSYAALYTPHVKIYDKFNDREVEISPCGFVASAVSFSKRNFEIWYPSAGFKRGKFNALGLVKVFTDGEADALADNQINMLKFTQSDGHVIWDQQTLLSRPSQLQSLHIRLLLAEMKEVLKPLLDSFLFDLNDAATRALVKDKVDVELLSFQARRGLLDFETIVDDSNNTPQTIANNELVVDILIKPTPYVRTIPVTIALLNPGTSFQLASQLV